MAWSTSNRRSRLPDDWPRIRRRILRRDPTCRLCGRRESTQVDHIQPGDNHSDTNLRGVCAPCHGWKSSSEGGAAAQKRRREMKAAQMRPPEKHPGGWS